MKSQSYYEDILDLHGLDEMKETIKKWNAILTNLKSKSDKAPILLPNLFLKSKLGAGKSNFIHLLSEYLYSTGFMTFYGDVKYFEFFLEYCDPSKEMSEINRFAEQLKTAAGFRNEYRGVVAIDLSEWAKHEREENFILFLEYMSIIDINVCIVFTINDVEQGSLTEMEKVISSFCRVRSVEFLYPSKEEFTKYSKKLIGEYNLTLDERAEKLLCESIGKLMESEYFYGYKTINRLCLDIVFEIGSFENMADGLVSAEHLKDFSKDSDFIEKLCVTKKISRIGFGGEV